MGDTTIPRWDHVAEESGMSDIPALETTRGPRPLALGRYRMRLIES